MLSLSFSSSLVNAETEDYVELNYNNWTSDYNLNTWNPSNENSINNDFLDDIKEDNDSFFGGDIKWEIWIKNLLDNIGKSLKNIFFSIAWLYLVILVLKLVFTDNTEEEVEHFKKWVIWISIWLVITQVAYSFVKILYDQDISEWLAKKFIDDMIYPFIELLQTWAAFFFIAIMFYAFFRTISANWDEEKIKNSRMSIFYSLVWLIVVKLAEAMVDTMYWEINCNEQTIAGVVTIWTSNCSIEEDLEWAVGIIINVINWVNSFLWILLTILIIYAGFQYIFSFGNEDSVKKAKATIIYIIIWLTLLFINYLILTFFIIPENPIV